MKIRGYLFFLFLRGLIGSALGQVRVLRSSIRGNEAFAALVAENGETRLGSFAGDVEPQ